MINLALFIAFFMTLFITYKQSAKKDTKTLVGKILVIGIVFLLIGILVSLFFKAAWIVMFGYIAYLVYVYYKTQK